MGNLERLAIGVSSIGGVAGIGMFLNKSLYTDDIQSKLKANNYEILNKKDQYGHWERMLDVYKKLAGEEETKFKFSNQNINSKEALQKACEEVLKKRVGESNKENNYYAKAKRWCTVPTIVSKVIGKERVILDTDIEKDEANQREWDKKIQEYKSKDNKDKIKDLNFEDKKPPADKDKDNRKVIKTKCKELNEKQSYEEGYKEALEKSKTWCTIEKKKPENK